MIERTLVLLKPDAVQRALVGEIIKRFENSGLKIIGLKLVHADKELSSKHYTEELAQRRGEHVRNWNIDFISSNPVVAIAIEGVNAIENVRKMVGETEPKAALPGTIRGDFSHISYSYCDNKKMVVKNVIHASANKEDAERELDVWFKKNELFSYRSAHDEHVL